MKIDWPTDFFGNQSWWDLIVSALAIFGAGYAVVQWFRRTFLRHPLRLFAPPETISLVLHGGSGSPESIHVRGVLHNQADVTKTLTSLQAELRMPSGKKVQLDWRNFLGFERGKFVHDQEVHPVSVGPDSSIVLRVELEFRGSVEDLGTGGTYTLVFWGIIDQQKRSQLLKEEFQLIEAVYLTHRMRATKATEPYAFPLRIHGLESSGEPSP